MVIAINDMFDEFIKVMAPNRLSVSRVSPAVGVSECLKRCLKSCHKWSYLPHLHNQYYLSNAGDVVMAALLADHDSADECVGRHDWN